MQSICSFQGCGLPRRCLGFCTGHQQQQHAGRPLAPLLKNKARRGDRTNLSSVEEAFRSFVDITDGCYLWTGRKISGYGVFHLKGTQYSAHRVAFERSKGPIPAGMVIDHICHNPACVRPSHLQAVSHKANMENRSGAHRNSKSGIRGVYWDTERSKWVAEVRHNRRNYRVGRFENIEDAAAAVSAARRILHSNSLLDLSGR